MYAGPAAAHDPKVSADHAAAAAQASLSPTAALHQWRPQASAPQAQPPAEDPALSQGMQPAVRAEVQECLLQLAMGADACVRLLCALCRHLRHICSLPQGKDQQLRLSQQDQSRHDRLASNLEVAAVHVIGMLMASSKACRRLALKSVGVEDPGDGSSGPRLTHIWLRSVPQ